MNLVTMDHSSFASYPAVSVATTSRDSVIGKTKLKKCPVESAERLKEQKWSKSQSDEDMVLLQWFNGLCDGRFLEMGALDGVMFSNSYLYEVAFQWKGLLIELSPTSFQKLQVNRGGNSNTLVNAGVCENRQTLHYFSTGVPATNGIVEFAAQDFRDRWWKNLKPDLSNAIQIECLPLQEIIDEHYQDEEVVHFDFYSLDVEGAEYQVLKSIDFTRVSFGIIFLEADELNEMKNLATRAHLESNGYRFLMEKQKSYWFMNRNFGKIYDHVLHSH